MGLLGSGGLLLNYTIEDSNYQLIPSKALERKKVVKVKWAVQGFDLALLTDWMICTTQEIRPRQLWPAITDADS